MKPSAYIAGPVSGIFDDNRPMFEAARERLRAAGWLPIVPLDFTREIVSAYGQCPALVWCLCMVKVLPLLEAADAIFLLPGWESSRGATREHDLALDMGKPVLVAGRGIQA